MPIDNIPFHFFHSDVKEAAGAEAPDDAAAEPAVFSPTSEAAASSSSPTPAPSSSPSTAEKPPSSPKLVAEADGTSQMSGSGCTSQASVDDEDDVPVTDIYFVSNKPAHTYINTESLVFLQ